MKKGHCYQSITLLGSCARSLFGEPLQFTSGIPRKNSSYLLTKQRPLWLHVAIFTNFNQPLTISNTATVTLPDTKNPHVRMTPRRPSVRYFLSLLLLFFSYISLVFIFSEKKNFNAFTCSKLSNVENMLKFVSLVAKCHTMVTVV